ncbi:MAG: diguanylate cyclase [Schwartzia sp.]|nr:diguanylate cyclase [Schwartzia sp. (in: firmicutes)]
MKYAMTFKGRVWLVGLPAAMAEDIKKTPLPEQMECEFSVFRDVPEDDSIKNPDGIIFAAEKPGLAAALRALAGPQAFLVAWQESREPIAIGEFEPTDDIWEAPSKEMLAFRVKRFFIRLVHRYEHWLEMTFWQTTINMVPDLVWYKNLDGLHLEINEALANTVGKTRDDCRGQRHGYIWGLSPEEYEKGEFACKESDKQVIDSGHLNVGEEQVLENGELRDLRTYKTPLFDKEGHIFGTAGVAQDITLLNRYHQKILDMAHKDELTGLANRRFFYEYLAEHRKRQTTCVMSLDLDHFKHVNDNYGHKAGDEALKIVGNVLRDCFPGALVCRFGGDEFLVLELGGVTLEGAEAGAKEFLNRLRIAFGSEKKFEGLSSSVGIALTEDNDFPIDELVRRSDEALYAAKDAGRNCVRLYDRLEHKQPH